MYIQVIDCNCGYNEFLCFGMDLKSGKKERVTFTQFSKSTAIHNFSPNVNCLSKLRKWTLFPCWTICNRECLRMFFVFELANTRQLQVAGEGEWRAAISSQWRCSSDFSSSLNECEQTNVAHLQQQLSECHQRTSANLFPSFHTWLTNNVLWLFGAVW